MFDSIMRTQVVEDSYKCKWRLENFSQISTLSDHSCPDIRFANNTWFLKLGIKNGSMCIKLCESNSYGDLEIVLKSRVSVVDFTETVLHSESRNVNILHCNSTRKSEYDLSFIHCDTLKDIAQSHNDSVIIIIELTISKLVTKEVKHVPDKRQFQDYAEKSLCKDILKMYDDTEQKDVVLNVQGEKINAHKFILCARSSVFLKMFQQNMAESARNVVDVQDVGADAMKLLVDFMYSRVKGNYDFRTALDVYYAANKYQVQGLIKSCRKVLLDDINENNVFQLLVLSDQHKDQIMKEAVMKYINDHFKFCVMSEWWNDFVREKPDLFQEFKKFVKENDLEHLLADSI